MEKWIEAWRVDEVLHDAWVNRPLDSDRWVIGDIQKALADLPAADVAPVRHGHWEPIDVNRDEFHCSLCVCRIKWGTVTSAKYCPMCGAKMDA